MRAPFVPTRILCISEGQLGDLLILTPALRALKESFPSSFLSVLILSRRTYGGTQESGASFRGIFSPTGGPAQVLLNDPHIDAVFEIDRTRLREQRGFARLRAEAGVIRWLRQQACDTVICTFPQDRFFLWAYLSGARLRVGEGTSMFLNRRIAEGKGERGVLRYCCALAEAAGANVASYETRVVVPAASEPAAAAVIASLGLPDRRFVLVHPGASGTYRIWPPERYAAVIDGLQKDSGIPVLLCGGEYDREIIEAVRASCRTEVRTLISTEGVGHLAALLKHAALALSNNSGPRHLAVAVGTPSLAVIPRFDDRAWKIYADESRAGTVQSDQPCVACGASECRNLIPPGSPFGAYCLHAIPPESVLTRISNSLMLWGRPGGSPLQHF